MKVFLVLLVFVLPSYQWIIGVHYFNLLYVIENKWTQEQKYEIKLGEDYKFVSYIIKNYPKNSMLIISKKLLKEKSLIKNEAWVTYFIYPRRVKYE